VQQQQQQQQLIDLEDDVWLIKLTQFSNQLVHQ